MRIRACSTGCDNIRKNIDFVGYVPQWESSWTFHIAGKAKKVSDVHDEILNITKKILDISEGFFIPTRIEYYLSTKSEDVPANNIFSALGFDTKSIESYQKVIESDNGISYQEFKKDIQSVKTPENVIRYIRRIKMYGKTRFILEGKDEYIDINSKGSYAESGYDEVLSLQEILTHQAIDNPLRFDLFHSSSKCENQYVKSTDPAYYELVFWTYTDMWFEKTEIGSANRNRLRTVFKKIYNNYDVVYTLFISDGFSEEKLKNVVFGQD